jgi:hypothetical protein
MTGLTGGPSRNTLWVMRVDPGPLTWAAVIQTWQLDLISVGEPAIVPPGTSNVVLQHRRSERRRMVRIGNWA